MISRLSLSEPLLIRIEKTVVRPGNTARTRSDGITSHITSNFHSHFTQDGKQRIWEAAARKTRKSTGVDAVAIVPILKHPSKPVSTMIIVQYRPPVEAFCVEFPAGLIDEGESPEQAAVRELREETGYSGKVCWNAVITSVRIVSANVMITGERHQPYSEQPAWHDQR
jgi:hypothetical protein